MTNAPKRKTKEKAISFDAFVGRKLRALRELHDESQQMLAVRLDISFQQVQKYEKGINQLSHRKIYDLSHQYNVPMTYFSEGFAESGNAGSITDEHIEPVFSRASLRVARLFNQLDNEKSEKAVLNLLGSMLDAKQGG